MSLKPQVVFRAPKKPLAPPAPSFSGAMRICACMTVLLYRSRQYNLSPVSVGSDVGA